MALVCADVGELLLLEAALGKSTPENLTLKLYSNNYTPLQSSVAGSFTEATFTSYAAKTLTKTSWTSASTVSNKATSSYAAQSWTCGATGQTIYGYFVIGQSSGTLYFAERFSTSRSLSNGDVLNLTPAITLNSEN